MCTSAGLNNSEFFEDRDITRGTLCIPKSYIVYHNCLMCEYLGKWLPAHPLLWTVSSDNDSDIQPYSICLPCGSVKVLAAYKCP